MAAEESARGRTGERKMKKKRSGIKIYRTSLSERKRSRVSLSFFCLQTGVLCLLMILWWNAFLNVFAMPFDKVRLYGSTAAVILLLEIAVRRFGWKAGAAAFAAAAGILWYNRDIVIELYNWTVENYEVILHGQPSGDASFSYIAALLAVPVLEVLLSVQRSGKGTGWACIVLCSPFIAAACAGVFQTVLPAWLLVLASAAYFVTVVPDGGGSGKGLFLWKYAVLSILACIVLGGLSFGAGRLLDTGRASEDSFYFTTRDVIRTEVIGRVEDVLYGSAQERRNSPSAEEIPEEPDAEDIAFEDPAYAEEPETEEPDHLTGFGSETETGGVSTEESGTTDLNSLARFEPSEGEPGTFLAAEQPDDTVYYALSWGYDYLNDSWIMSAEPPSEEESLLYPLDIYNTLSELCNWNVDSLEEVSRNISRELSERAAYDTAPGAVPAGKEFLEYFLFENHKGFCVHFATAATLMYRYCGYSARYVEGYAIPASAFRENEGGKYEAQVTGAMGHAWCQVYDEQTGEWLNMEHTPPAPDGASGLPPAASTRDEMTVGERIVYDIFPVLIPVCLAVALCVILFFGQAAVRTARREQRFRKKRGGEGIREMYDAVIKTAVYQGMKIEDPLREGISKELYMEYPEIREEEWNWMYTCVMENMFYHPDDEKKDWAKMRALYTRFRKTATEHMGRVQRWRLRFVHCL